MAGLGNKYKTKTVYIWIICFDYGYDKIFKIAHTKLLAFASWERKNVKETTKDSK